MPETVRPFERHLRVEAVARLFEEDVKFLLSGQLASFGEFLHVVGHIGTLVLFLPEPLVDSGLAPVELIGQLLAGMTGRYLLTVQDEGILQHICLRRLLEAVPPFQRVHYLSEHRLRCRLLNGATFCCARLDMPLD